MAQSKTRSGSLHRADARNRKAFLGLHESLRKVPRPIAFVGAGVSVDAGYPDWKTLLDRLHQAAFPRGGKDAVAVAVDIARNKDGPWRAEVYRERLGTRYSRVLKKALRPQRNRASHGLARHLAGLSFAHYLTTNYDTVLHRAIAANGRGGPPRQVDGQKIEDMRAFLAEINRDRTRQLIYLHGRIAEPRSIVLTESDYLKRYKGTQRAERDLFAVLATRQVVFVGFSLSDPDLVEILRVMRGEERGRPRHFALLPLESADEEGITREYYRRKYGVETVFYLNTENHGRLATLLKLLRSTELDPDKIPAIGGALTRLTGAGDRPAIRHPEDPQKGMWGGKSEANGRRVTAEVRAVDRRQDWFRIEIRVTAVNARPLRGAVTVHVHDTFAQPYYEATNARNGLEAVLVLHAYGAFTIGVVCDEGDTKLELDLAADKKAPAAFRAN